jgi:long-subunit acyl-CoA synthetase (AMP-forming)
VDNLVRITQGALQVEDKPTRVTFKGTSLPQLAAILDEIVASRGACTLGRLPSVTFDPVESHGDLALVLCSSGSTGLPKGVALSHLNVVTALRDR